MVTLGEGGMITTSRKDLYERMLSFRSLCCLTYDPKGKYLPIDETKQPMGKRYWYLDFDDVGFNFRMTDAQAAVGLVQLRKLDGFNARRIEIANRYCERLRGIRGLTTPYVSPDVKHVFHIYCVLVEPEFRLNKEDFMWELYTAKRIKVWSHYMPIHLTTAYRKLGHAEGECPVAEGLFHKYVSLPIHPRMTEESDCIRDRQHPGACMTAFEATVAAPSRRGEVLRARASRFTSHGRPGRLDLMGGNVDYTGGLVFEATIREATWAAVQLRGDRGVISSGIRRWRSAGGRSAWSSISMRLTDEDAVRRMVNAMRERRWTAYVLGIFYLLRQRYPDAVIRRRQRLYFTPKCR